MNQFLSEKMQQTERPDFADTNTVCRIVSCTMFAIPQFCGWETQQKFQMTVFCINLSKF